MKQGNITNDGLIPHFDKNLNAIVLKGEFPLEIPNELIEKLIKSSSREELLTYLQTQIKYENYEGAVLVNNEIKNCICLNEPNGSIRKLFAMDYPIIFFQTSENELYLDKSRRFRNTFSTDNIVAEWKIKTKKSQ